MEDEDFSQQKALNDFNFDSKKREKTEFNHFFLPFAGFQWSPFNV
jgi:hypothetical protein